MSRLSLKLRLTLVFAAVMAVLLAAIGAVLYVELGQTLDEQIDASLAARRDGVVAFARAGGAGLAAGPRLTEDEDGFAQVLAADGSVLDGTPNLPNRPVLETAELEAAIRRAVRVESTTVRGLDDNPFRLVATAVTRNGDTVVVVAGASLEDRNEALDELRVLLLIGGPLALGVACVAAYLLAAAALRPVEAMRQRAAEISARRPGMRLPQPSGDDEIARLARTLNQMLGRLEEGIARERRFVAEASHELRTPLATLKAELELALRRPRSPKELEAALASAADETDRLTQLAEGLLLLARSDEGVLRLEPEPLEGGDVLQEVARRFKARAEAEGRAITVDRRGQVPLEGDRLRIEQALGNLVDNALRHGEGTITLVGSTENGWAVLAVADEGPGLPAELAASAFERFVRGGEARATHAGSGLGLAIVAAIAQAHGGEARLAPGVGARVTLLLPVGHDPVVDPAAR